jgi:acetyltransferase-like isoleucine patch superfamily enzyme
MLLIEIIKKIKFDLWADRLGPDIPFTHWQLYFPNSMRSLCLKKFKKFGEFAQFRPGAYAVGCSQIELGRLVVIRPGCKLFGETPHLPISIIIEDDVILGSDVHIYINNHRFDNLNIPIINQGHYLPKQVLLKKGCWIGANCTILPGVVVGENSVIGAGSIVTKSIPAGVVAVGNPAKIVKSIFRYEI